MSTSDLSTFVPTTRHDTYPAISPSHTSLSGKVVLITGASKGIGRATALALAQSGARGVALLARSDLSAVKAAVTAAGAGVEVLALSADVTNHEQVVSALKRVEETFGRLDVVVNCAGYLEKVRPVGDSSPEDWWATWDANVRGTYNVVRAAIPLLVSCGGDRTIISVSSKTAALLAPGFSAYSTSKFALLRFTEFVNVEHGAQGVLAYCVHPGAIDTEFNKDLPHEYRHMLTETVELPAHTIAWLLRERREWLAGRYVDCTWDVEELSAKKEEIVEGDKLKCKLVL